MQQSVIQLCADNLDSFRQDKRPLELSRGDSAMQKFPFGIVNLPAANNQLCIFDQNRELILGKPGNGE